MVEHTVKVWEETPKTAGTTELGETTEETGSPALPEDTSKKLEVSEAPHHASMVGEETSETMWEAGKATADRIAGGA